MFKGLACGILAGGRGTRLGNVEKALVNVNGRPLLAHLLDRLKTRFPSIVLSTNKPDLYAWTKLACAPDLLDEKCSLAGLHGLLSAIKEPRALILACDMPNVSFGLVEELIARKADVVLPVSPGGDEPLHAIYSTKCVKAIEEAARAGRFKMTDFMDDVKTVRVRVESEEPFFNINTPADLKRFTASSR